jgi:D-xylose transport system ATP-binding protein
MTAVTQSLLCAEGITKEYPGVRALEDVTFHLDPGEVHALVGENGAGKSTLIKILSGVIPAGQFQGRILLEGTPVHFRTPRGAESAGISVIHQELALVPHLSVGENIFLGKEPHRWGVVDWEVLFAGAGKVLEGLGLAINPRQETSRLSIGVQQLVEIAKALHKEARVLILDEPTSALSEEETRVLLNLVKALRLKGTSIVYITHKLKEVFELADRITVLRDGSSVATDRRDRWKREDVVRHMVGRPIQEIFPGRRREPGKKMLEVENLSVRDPRNPARNLVKGISFHVSCGEVLGLAGLMGAGRSELLCTLFGYAPGPARGVVRIAGRPVKIRSPGDAVREGVAMVPEDRGTQGLIGIFSVLENLTMSHLESFCTAGIIDTIREYEQCRNLSRTLRIKSPSVLVPAETLSGGNQQKVVIGKWLMDRPRILFLDDPTRGIDVGAKVEIYNLIDRLAGEGMAVIFVSSELPEVLGVADRILVLREGRLTGEFQSTEATPELIMEAATA